MTGPDFQRLIFQAARLDFDKALSALQYSGCILIRAVFEPRMIVRLLKRAQRVFALRQRQLEAGTLPQGYAKNYDYGCMTYIGLRELDWPGEPPLQVVELFRRSLLLPLLQAYYQGPVWLNQLESNVRCQRQDLPELLIPFHQDGPFQGQRDYPQVNCWLPLLPAGKDVPGLEVAPVGTRELWPVVAAEAIAENPHYASYALKSEKVLAAIGGEAQLWHPELWPGDVLIMDPYLVHRTYVTPAMQGARYSLELRTLPASTLPIPVQRCYGMLPLTSRGGFLPS